MNFSLTYLYCHRKSEGEKPVVDPLFKPPYCEKYPELQQPFKNSCLRNAGLDFTINITAYFSYKHGKLISNYHERKSACVSETEDTYH